MVRIEEGRHWQVKRPEDARWMVEESGASWGYSGSGPISTARVLLDDACLVIADLAESRGFASEVLARLDVNASEVRLTVAEVKAWWRERRNEAVARLNAESDREFGPEEQRELLERLIHGPVYEGFAWLGRRRETHPPRFT